MAELFKSWQDVAHILGAELDYTDQREDLNREEAIHMRVRHRYWTIAFESRTNSQGKNKINSNNKIYCPLSVLHPFSFNIFEERLKHRLFKIMGLQDIRIGDPVLDKRFIFQANNEDHIRQFLSRPLVRAGFASPYVQQLRLSRPERAENGHDEHQLLGRTDGRMHAKAEILAHFQLFAAALDALHSLEIIPTVTQ